MRKVIFTAIGIIEDGPKKKLRLNSPDHWQHWVNKLVPGKKYAISVEEQKASRTRSQLNYYWVVISYLADYSGYDSMELHDAIMRKKFGTKRVVLGDVDQEVRKSIADVARFPLSNMVELIEEVLKLAYSLGVKIPTKEELGYI